MLIKKDFIKKHWKPPFAINKQIILVIFLTYFVIQLTHAQNSSENPEDSIEVHINATSYRLEFYLDDTENYEIQNVSCNFIKALDETETSKHVCENLNPCSTYLAMLFIRNLQNEQITEKAMNAVTDYAKPEVVLGEIEAFVDGMHLTWTATEKTCISSFHVEVISVEKEYKWTLTSDDNELSINGLNPCQEHNIQLKTIDKNDVVVSNLPATQETEYIEPETIPVTIEHYENAKVKVSWDQPKYKSCIRYYNLRWFLPDCSAGIDVTDMPETTTTLSPSNDDENSDADCEWFAKLNDGNAIEYIIDNLQGCEAYQFELFVNENKTSKCEQQNFTSPEDVPGIITNKTPVLEATNITLLWNPPASNVKCLLHYQINVIGPLQRSEELQKTIQAETLETEYLFDELDPCGEYNFTVLAVSLNGSKGTEVNSTYHTTEAKPTMVENVNIEAAAFSVNMSWMPPKFSDLCVTSYRISGWKNENEGSFNDQTTNTYLYKDGLNSCQTYVIQIIPVITEPIYMDGEPKQIEVETLATKPQKPNNFQATGLYPNSLELSAFESDFENKCETIFARFVCELSKDNNDVLYKTAEQYVEGQVGGISFKALLAPLSPFTSYKCNVALFNVAGWSPNQTLIKSTEPYFPDPPQQIKLSTSTHSTCNFVWTAPKYPNGNIKLYITYFQRVEAAFYLPPGCKVFPTDPIIRETSSLELLFPNLLPFTRYSIQIAAQNEYGVGEYTRPFMIVTKPYVSEPVQNLKVLAEGPYESDVEYKAKVIVSWTAPCKSNGDIEYFKVDFMGEREDHETEVFSRTVQPAFDENGSMVYNETNLKPEYNYIVNVVVKTTDVETKSSEARQTFEAPAGIPKRMNETVISQARVTAYEANNPTNSAVVRLPANILESESGTILYIAYLLSEKGCNPVPVLKYGALNINECWPQSLTYGQAYIESGCIHQYQTTPQRWKPTPLTNSRDAEQEIVYLIGADKCAVSAKQEDDFCNGHLKPDTEYHLVVRLFTKSGWSDAGLLQFKTEAVIPLMLILISVSSCLLLAFIAGFIYLWVKKRIIWHRESCHGIEDSFGDINAKKYVIYYNEIFKPEKIAREFKELTVVAMDLSYAASELGSSKNRYADIFPYDKNRVILDIDADGSDYINASFIDGYRRRKEYIATQGPKPESALDFWRMILQHNVRVIVMVTQFRELDVVKCYEYYPYKSKGINAVVKKKDSFELYDRTEFLVSHEIYGLKQKVVHFFYKKWPDHGCPADPLNLITFVRKVKAERVPSYSPIVVHCSAGVGRTGTFIALDIIMQRLKSEGKINIYETVKKLRFQRMKMVQTMTQYTFLYSCTYDLLKNKYARPTMKSLSDSGNSSCSSNSSIRSNNNHNGIKKVSFQDDIEASAGSNSTTERRRRRNGSDLSSVEEHNDESSDINAKTQSLKLKNSYIKNIPLWLNNQNGGGGGAHKSLNIVSLDENLTSDNEKNNNESVM